MRLLSLKIIKFLGFSGKAARPSTSFSYFSVYLCQKDSHLYAAKVFTCSLSRTEPFKREVELLRLLDHPNVIKMKEFFPSTSIKFQDKMEVQKAVIVLEYAENGDLFEYISICKGFKPHICRSIFLEILRTMEYLKDKGVSHRDLKP